MSPSPLVLGAGAGTSPYSEGMLDQPIPPVCLCFLELTCGLPGSSGEEKSFRSGRWGQGTSHPPTLQRVM